MGNLSDQHLFRLSGYWCSPMNTSTTSTQEYLENKRYGNVKRENARIKAQRSQLIRDREEQKRQQLQSEIESMRPHKRSIINHSIKVASRIKGALQWGIKA
jgi:hypothetical protein